VSKRLTAEQFESLPQFARDWIYDLETRCDQTGEFAELRLMQDTVKAQQVLLAELEGKATRWSDNAVQKGEEIRSLKDKVERAELTLSVVLDITQRAAKGENQDWIDTGRSIRRALEFMRKGK
jgi:predicted SPOUT superfamily RNA methylase MTH1